MRSLWSLVFLGTTTIACTKLSTGAGSGPPLHILIVAMDTVRWDRTSLAGHSRDTTPNLAAFAALPGSVTFTEAYTDASWSEPAYMSLFTGLESMTHGVGFRQPALRRGQATLAGMLRANGYTTRAYASGPHLAPQTGMDHGFDAYEHTVTSRSLAVQVDPVLEWLTEDAEAPRFAFVHGYDAHAPYPSPMLVAGAYADAPLDTDTRCAVAGWHCYPEAFPAASGPALPDSELAALGLAYDAALTFADHQLGRLLYGLQAAGRLEDTLVIVLSDHGEMLGEDGGRGHAYGHDARVFQVPLVVRVPNDARAREVNRTVALSDLLPTLAARIQTTPPSGVQGQVIGELLPGGDAPAPQPHRAASHCCYFVRDGSWTLSGVGPREAGENWLLRRDGAPDDQSAAHPARLATMLALLSDWPEAPGRVDLVTRQLGARDPALKRALQEGGYWKSEQKEPASR